MVRRHALLRCGMGWIAAFFMAGCLFPSASKREAPFVGVEQKSDPPQTMEPARLMVEAPLELVSPYARPIARSSAPLDAPAIERVRLEITPTPRPATHADPESLPPPEPPAPRPPAPVPPPPERDPKESPLLAALRCVLAQHPDEARALLEKYEKPDREQLVALLRLTAGISGNELDRLKPAEAEQLLEQLQVLAGQLQRRAPLVLGKVCFCSRIESFGQYRPLHPDFTGFQAGCDSHPGERVQIYAEVHNFSSREHNGQYETVLATSLEISAAGAAHTDPDHLPLVKMKLGPCIDRSRTPRQDYFLNFQFHVPIRLPPGLYTLWLTVKDMTPGQPVPDRIARRSLDFKVCPPGARPLTP